MSPFFVDFEIFRNDDIKTIIYHYINHQTRWSKMFAKFIITGYNKINFPKTIVFKKYDSNETNILFLRIPLNLLSYGQHYP